MFNAVMRNNDLTETLLPIRRHITFLRSGIRIIFLRHNGLTNLTILISRYAPIRMFFRPIVFFRFQRRPILRFMLSPLTSSRFLHHASLARILFYQRFQCKRFDAFRRRIISAYHLIQGFIGRSQDVLFRFRTM